MFAITLIVFWNVCNLFGSMRIMMGRAIVYDKLTAEKCVEDASEYIWLRWEARSVLIGNRKCQIKLYCAISLIVFWNVCNLFGSMRIMMGRAIVYDKLTAEKCVEDASEYIWLRWEARSVLIGIRKCQIKLYSAISLIVFWNVVMYLEQWAFWKLKRKVW